MIKTQHCPNCEATEQKLHDFRQEVSKIVSAYVRGSAHDAECEWGNLDSLIIPAPKPDPLVSAAESMGYYGADAEGLAEEIRAALDAVGLEIREKANDQ